jgi:hypothetical protein
VGGRGTALRKLTSYFALDFRAYRKFEPLFSSLGAVSPVPEAVNRAVSGEECLSRAVLSVAASARGGRLRRTVTATRERRPRRIVSPASCLEYQAAWKSGSGRAGERGGARAGHPRSVRSLRISAGASMAAMSLNSPPHCGHGSSRR